MSSLHILDGRQLRRERAECWHILRTGFLLNGEVPSTRNPDTIRLRLEAIGRQIGPRAVADGRVG